MNNMATRSLTGHYQRIDMPSGYRHNAYEQNAMHTGRQYQDHQAAGRWGLTASNIRYTSRHAGNPPSIAQFEYYGRIWQEFDGHKAGSLDRKNYPGSNVDVDHWNVADGLPEMKPNTSEPMYTNRHLGDVAAFSAVTAVHIRK